MFDVCFVLSFNDSVKLYFLAPDLLSVEGRQPGSSDNLLASPYMVLVDRRFTI